MVRPAPARHAVGKALQLDSVPVHRRRLGQPVHHGDPHRPPSLEHQRRPGDRRRVGRRLQTSPSCSAYPMRWAESAGDRAAWTSSRSFLGSAGAGAAAVGAPLAGATRMPSTRPAMWCAMCSPSCRPGPRYRRQRLLVGDMEGEMAVEEPVARPHRGPARGHGPAGRHELGHDHSTVAAAYTVSAAQPPRLSTS